MPVLAVYYPYLHKQRLPRSSVLLWRSIMHLMYFFPLALRVHKGAVAHHSSSEIVKAGQKPLRWSRWAVRKIDHRDQEDQSWMLIKNLLQLLGKKINWDSQGNLSRDVRTPLFIPYSGRWCQRPVPKVEKGKFWSWLSRYWSAGEDGEGSQISSLKAQRTSGRSD